MMSKTHMIAGATAGILLASHIDLNYVETTAFVGITALGSLLPDIDHSQSKMGRRLFFISYPINKIFGHRTFTHSVLFHLLLLLSGWLFFAEHLLWVISFLIGSFSHVLLDMLNPKGVALFYPNTKKVSVLGVRTGGFTEVAVTLFFAILLIVLSFSINSINHLSLNTEMINNNPGYFTEYSNKTRYGLSSFIDSVKQFILSFL